MTDVALVPRQAREVRIERELAAEHRPPDDVIVVEHRVHDGLLGLIVVNVDVGVGRVPSRDFFFVVLALHVEIVAADIEEIAIAHAGQVDGGGEVLPRRRRCCSRG